MRPWIVCIAMVTGCTCAQPMDLNTGDTAPVEVLPTAPDQLQGPLVDVAITRVHRCGLGEDGVVQCWGEAPSEFFSVQRYIELDASDEQICGVTETHGVICMAVSGNTSESALPAPGPQVELEDFSAGVSLGEWCALVDGITTCDLTEFAEADRTGAVRGFYQACTWGTDGVPLCELDDYYTKLPKGDFVATYPKAATLQAGTLSPRVCLVDLDGEVQCFADVDTPWGASPAGPFERVWASTDYACARTSAGELACWGADGPATAPSGTGFGDVSMEADAACAVTMDALITCWDLPPT